MEGSSKHRATEGLTQAEAAADWLSHASTWTALANKLALFGLFGLCADINLEAVKRTSGTRVNKAGQGPHKSGGPALAQLWAQVGKMRIRSGDIPGAAVAMKVICNFFLVHVICNASLLSFHAYMAMDDHS